MRIRGVLAIFAFGLICLPASLLPLFSLIFHPALPAFMGASNGVIRAVATERAVQGAIRIGADGGLEARPGYRLPEWLDIVVVAENGIVVLSDNAGFAVGERADMDRVMDFAKAEAPNTRALFQTISRRGETLGAYAARFGSYPLALGEDPARPFVATSYLVSLAALVLGLSWVLGARLAAGISKLERAADRIASGDLGGTVAAKGAREILSLARAMEGMRSSLAEDRSRRARLLAAISHDLRTPLTSVKGFLEAIQDGMAPDPATLARYVSIMREKALDLEDKISELLEFARIGTGEWRMALSEFELRPWLEGLASGYAMEAREAGILFSSRLEAAAGATARADERLLRRALENVFSNALRYAPSGSTISLNATQREGGLELALADQGPGMPPDELERAFEPYFRGSNRKGEGLGLGLSIARSILADHGWGIRAETPPGGGCRFVIDLPGL